MGFFAEKFMNKKYKYDVYLSIGVEIESNLNYNNDNDNDYETILFEAIEKAKNSPHKMFNIIEIQKQKQIQDNE